MSEDKFLFTVKFTPGQWCMQWCDKDGKYVSEPFMYQFTRYCEVTFRAPKIFEEIEGLNLDYQKFR